MKSKSILFILLLFTGSSLAGNSVEKKEITDYLPTSKELKDWKPLGEPEIAVDEDLFILINGGAEIYQEYGFVEAVLQEYSNENDKSVNVEIYRMKSPASAFGVYSFKTGKSGRPMSIGQGALLEEYYMNFWKGNLLVTLTGFDSEKETINGLIHIARAVESKIEQAGKRPELIDLLPLENLNPLSVKYLKGNLALFNNYEFDSRNIFGMTEGVIGNYGDARAFIFEYEDEREQQTRFNHAEKILATKDSFSDFTKNETGFILTDRFNQTIFVEPYQSYIIITMGFNRSDSNKMLKKIQATIETMTH